MTVPPNVDESGQLAGRIKALDGLRALVLLIVAFHFSLEAARATESWIAIPVWSAGIFGVIALDVFFVLSGFLITGILLDTKGAPGFFRNFYGRRSLRILPLYYGFLAFYLLVLPRVVPWDAGGVTLTPREQLPYWLYLVNFAFGLDWRTAAYAGHYWSLSIEEQFYLLWPLAVFLLDRNRFRQLTIACLIIAPVARLVCSYALPDHILFTNTFTLAKMDGLALGALIAGAWREPGALASIARTIRRVGAVGGVLMVGLILWLVPALVGGTFVPSWRVPLFLTASVWIAGVVVVTILEGRGGIVRRVAESWPARRIGLYSYAIYVIHDPLAYIFDRSGWITRPRAGATVGSVLTYVLVMGTVSVLVAALSWHAFEKPLLRLRPPQTVRPTMSDGG